MKRIFPGLAMLLLACSPAPEEPAGEKRTPMSSPTRWIPAVANPSAVLLEGPARVVSETPSVAEISASLHLRVRSVSVAVGDRIEAGEPVLEVYAPELVAAAARWLGGREQLAAIDERLAHLRALHKDGLARSDQLLELAVNRSETAAMVDANLAVLTGNGVDPSQARSIVRRGSVVLRAPLAGTVTSVIERLGRSEEPGTVFAVIEGERAARIEAELVGKMPSAVRATFVTLDGREIPLADTPVATRLEPRSGRTRVWLEPREPVLLPGGVSGTLRLRTKAPALEVPTSALVTRDGETRVYVLHDGAPKASSVQVVRDSGTSALVVGDLEAGQSVAEIGASVSGADGETP